MRPILIGLVGICLGFALVACGTSCEEIRREREAFEARAVEPNASREPDAQLVVPFTFIDRALERELGRRPPVEIRLPVEKLGLALTLTAKLDGLHARPEQPGRFGVRADIGLYEGGDKVVDVAMEGSALVRYHKSSVAPGQAGNRVSIELRRDQIGSMSSTTTSAGKRRLAEWLRGELPPVLKRLAGDELVGLVADELLVFFAEDIWPRVRGDLLGERATLFEAELALPSLPLADVKARSRDDALVLEMTTALPVHARLPADAPTPRGESLALVMTGETAAELVNHGMRTGLVPSRFGGDGKPKADGKWEARVGWRAGDASPLLVHLWQLGGECKSALVAGALKLSVKNDKVLVEVRDGRLERVRGPAFVEAFAWWEMLWGDAFEVVQEVAAHATFELDGRALEIELARAELDTQRLVIELEASW